MSSMKGAVIRGIGYSAPSKVMTNQDLEAMVDTNDEWIVSRTGIKERRIADKGDSTSRWACEAAVKALEQADISAEELDLIVCGTTTPDMPLPSTACLIQHELGATRAACFDLSAACAGFVYALSVGHQFVRTGQSKKVLVIGADQISPYIDWSDRTTCILFGDAAGACVLEASDDAEGVLGTYLGSDGKYADLIKIPGGGSLSSTTSKTLNDKQHYLKMNGKEVFKQAVRGMTQSIETILSQCSLSANDVSLIVPHQANMRIIEAVSQRLDVDKEKIYVNLDRYGNTSAASVIVGLAEAIERGRVKKGDVVLLATFGAGLVWASALLKL